MNRKDIKLLESFTSDKPSDLVFWSFRYFLGRQTIATCSFARSLATAWPYLDACHKKLIRRELEEAFASDDEACKTGNAYLPRLGWDCDRAAWQEVRNAYNKELANEPR